MSRSGTLVIVAIVLVGVSAAAFSVWYQQHQSQRSLQFWGAENARLIARAPVAEALRLDLSPEESDCPDKLEVLRGTICVERRREVSRAPGFSNIRRGLLQDASFDWDAVPPDNALSWEFGLRFEENGREVALLFDLTLGVASLAAAERAVALDKAAVADLKAFFAEQFGKQ